MQVKVLIFGQLTDITLNSEIYLKDISDSNTLIKALHEKYPELANSKYAIALDKVIIKQNTFLEDNSIIALLPPFSGG